jgi:hypothetical protein
MDIDVKIERIGNGYIVTDNDSMKNKHYYATLERFAVALIVEQLRECDRSICEHKAPDKPFYFKLSSDL